METSSGATTQDSARSLSPQLAEIATELDQCRREIQELVHDLSDAKVWQRPAKGGWSVGECIDHLTISSREMLPAIASALNSAPRSNGTYKKDLRGRLLIWFLEPPYRMRFKAIPKFTPGKQVSAQQLLSNFLASQHDVKSMLNRANGLALNKAIVTSPVDTRMKYNAFSALKLIPAHQRRHIWQASRIRQLI